MYVYINVNSMYRRSTISTMILDNTCVIFQCMKLLHVSFRISKIIKLSRCKYTRAHIVLILHYIESGIIICSKKRYTI